jgi:ribose 5-phosphate isomerase B
MQDDEVRQLVRKALQKALGEANESSAPVAEGSRNSARRSVTQADLESAAPGSEVPVPANALITPLARDLARDRGLKLVPESTGSPVSAPLSLSSESAPGQTVALGADHGGFELKEKLRGYLVELGYTVLDCGTSSSDSVDYPDFAYAVAKSVSDGRAARGIMVDGAGIGSCMAANKVPGIRAAMCYDLSTASNSREHNDANVLTLGGLLIGDNLARQIVDTWLNTAFGGDRHARRVNKIMAIEKRYLKK